MSATDKSSYPSDQDIRINNNLYLDRDSVQDMGGYTTREDNSSSTTSVVGERFGDGNNAKRSKDTLYVLAQQSHRYDRSKDKRMIEWGAQSTELRGVGWSNTDCGESDSSGDSGGLALGISRNTDASTGQVSQKRALTEPHQNNSTSAVDLGSKPSASQPRSSLRSPSRNTYTDLTLLMQQHEQKIDQNQNENSIVGNKVGIASVIARPGKPRILTEGSDEEMACDGYRPDSDQTSNDEVVSPSESSNQGKATFRGGRMSKQKLSLDDTLNNRPVPEMELSSSGPAPAPTADTFTQEEDQSCPTVGDPVVDPLLENQSLVGATEGMGLGGITRNSINGLKGKAARSSEDQFQDQDINYDGSSGPDTHSHEVVVGVEGKLSVLQSWESEPSESNLSKISKSSHASGSTSTSNTPLRMSDLYKQKVPKDGSSDVSINTLNSFGHGKSIFESYKEAKIPMSEVDPTAWSGRDIIEVIREDTPCLIIGISSYIIDDNDEAYDEGAHTVSAIRKSNQLRAEFVGAGADLVWAKPIPTNAWEQIRNVMPLEF